MRHLDLFSGIGGFALAARWVGWETVGFCEIDPYCQKVLRKHWPDVPIYDDVRELRGETVGHVDIITGGYPCQPFSVAGKRRGEADDRHLWPEFARLIRELRPRWVLGENVAGHISMGLDDVLADLEGLGYSWEAFVIPACAVDAKHRRARLWIVGNANNEGESTGAINDETSELPQVVADTASSRQSGQGQPLERGGTTTAREGQTDNVESVSIGAKWSSEPDVGRVVNGIPKRVDRLRGLGNAIVPQIAELIFRAIDSA